MANFISEDDIEQAIIKVFCDKSLNYDYLNCFTAKAEDLNDGSERSDKQQVVFAKHCQRALQRLNNGLPESAINEALAQLTESRTQLSAFDANKAIYQLIRNGITVKVTNTAGIEEPKEVQVFDFKQPENNDFLLVAQLWVQGELRWRRPDLIVYINGLPVVMLELKNSNISVKKAYDDNLTDYKRDIPRLFDYNAITLLSNARETRISSFESSWQHFSPWLRVDDEEQRINRKEMTEKQISLEYAVRGLFKKERLLDYIENFILYHQQGYKVVAKNHQFLGVNKAVKAVKQAEDGKLGVFWHTQGSGKSFSMVMLCRKIFHKLNGNYTFLIVTDRDDLDRQIYRNFLNTGATSKDQTSRPKNSSELRDYLGMNKRYIFTLIQKFNYPSGKAYPVLSERDDIIVIIDEAHRTQYNTLAENMRKGLPNAKYMAFTGTPLLAADEKTKLWFGDYVSRYDFAQSIEDGATVKLFYDKRLPEVCVQNDDLEDEFCQIVEDENLTDHQIERLENHYAKMVSVLTADDRLNTIAADIATHFPRRGYQGKAMVICLDKYTAVKMFTKVEQYWKTEIQALNSQISQCKDEQRKTALKNSRANMKGVEMAVIISEEAGEEEKFSEKGLDIIRHRKRINQADENGSTVEDNFKDPEHPLKIVFVCAMWLTGFDAPTVSTLYLDKPMKNHTLMQTIARANRTAPGKTCGIIVDYFNVFRNLNKTLADYSRPKKEGEESTEEEEQETAIEDKTVLLQLLKDAIQQGASYCLNLDINLAKIRYETKDFNKIALFDEYADKLLAKDEYRKQFNVYQNTIDNLYDASKPDILSGDQTDRQWVAIFRYLRACVDANVDQGNIEQAKRRIADLLDESILTDNNVRENWFSYRINREKEIDVSLLDFDALQTKFRESPLKNLELAHLRAYIEEKLQALLEDNHTRKKFAERLQGIIDEYNSGGRTTEQTFESMNNFKEGLSEEEQRHVVEGLTEAELEMFDLLYKEKLTAAELIAVKNASRDLLGRLREICAKKQFWFKNRQEQEQVKEVIKGVLDKDLPESYDKTIFNQKCDNVFHLIYERAVGSANAS